MMVYCVKKTREHTYVELIHTHSSKLYATDVSKDKLQKKIGHIFAVLLCNNLILDVKIIQIFKDHLSARYKSSKHKIFGLVMLIYRM